MVEVEKIREKIESGAWSAQDAADCIQELTFEYRQSLENGEWREDYSRAVYATSYGVFAYSYREHVFPLIELCQKLLGICTNSADQSRYYLALMRLYFVIGFQPKIVEYGLKYAESDYKIIRTKTQRLAPRLSQTDRSDLKSAYNSIVVAFTESNLFEEALCYLEKMIEVTRSDPAKPDASFWEGDTVNELVYLDSLVYINIGLGKFEDAAQAAKELGELIDTQVPDEQKAFFDIQKEFTLLYLRMHMEPETEEIADGFVNYIKQLREGDIAQSGISFCISYFAEFLEVLLHKNRCREVIEIGKFLSTSGLFTGNVSMIYKLMLQASVKSEEPDLQREHATLEKRYIEALEQEQESYKNMVHALTQEELRLVQLRKAMGKDTLTGCRNRGTFEHEGSRYLSDHPEGSLIFIDLDHLKEVNDKYGHNSGDQYLRQFARMLEGALGENEILYRYAGDEFIVLSNRSKIKAEVLMDELLKKNPVVFMLGDHVRRISFSYGAVEFGEMPGDIYAMIREADHRMYLCKKENHIRLLKEGL